VILELLVGDVRRYSSAMINFKNCAGVISVPWIDLKTGVGNRATIALALSPLSSLVKPPTLHRTRPNTTCIVLRRMFGRLEI
jgi:hypothetical protein